MNDQMADTKSVGVREPDLLGIGDCARAINRDISTTRGYLHELYAQRVPGVLRVSNGAFVVHPRALSALKRAVRGKRESYVSQRF